MTAIPRTSRSRELVPGTLAAASLERPLRWGPRASLMVAVGGRTGRPYEQSVTRLALFDRGIVVVESVVLGDGLWEVIDPRRDAP